MKLFYRGASYEAKSPAVAAPKGKVIGKYRGVEIYEHTAPAK
ncbi:MAG: DUF4278 domain-containing protein [Pegethrix bostrychoides GSE-TBD4-15B]|jgi:hypothetical protein|uniref:DUF4278 domain-containing protein n=1 Tax=Pegethrix bostrychoides GSE-TBD4-15B TaxID=2839662 RepID=A0A951U6K5_9CYAN|nr:DUF4278 domain-containing protein [Pegethrix bostrychoides GSE-TBD4-15B]